MKWIIFASLISFKLSAAVPQAWMDFSSNEKSSLESLNIELENLLQLKEEMLEQSSEDSSKSISDYKLAEQKTDISISKSGLIGFSALSGTSTVELTWTKKKEKELENLDEVITLDNEMTEQEMLMALSQGYGPILNRIGDSKQKKKIQDHWNEKAIEIHRALSEVSPSENMNFVPVKFRVDLTASYSAPLFGLTKLSGDARVRLEWNIVKQQTKSSRAQKMIEDLSEDISEALSQIELNDKQKYKIEQLSMGIGLNKKGIFSLSKVKGGVSGMLFFKKQKNSSKTLISAAEGTYVLDEEAGEKGLFKRSQMRKGISKSIKIGDWFSQKLATRNATWEVSKFKVNFTLSKSGLFGLSSVGGTSEIELYYKK